MDKHGECPNCKMSWSGEDVLDTLNSLSVFKNRTTKELKDIATNFGYKDERKTKFSKVIAIEKEGKVYYQCPNMRCGKVYNAITGEELEQEEEF